MNKTRDQIVNLNPNAVYAAVLAFTNFYSIDKAMDVCALGDEYADCVYSLVIGQQTISVYRDSLPQAIKEIREAHERLHIFETWIGGMDREIVTIRFGIQ